jgi:hypothetical protein
MVFSFSVFEKFFRIDGTSSNPPAHNVRQPPLHILYASRHKIQGREGDGEWRSRNRDGLLLSLFGLSVFHPD